VPPNQNVGPVASTWNVGPSFGRTTRQVSSRPEPAALEIGNSSGSSWPVQPCVYSTSIDPSM
jgi:hypothetical protein